jgi:hypothetical protein
VAGAGAEEPRHGGAAAEAATTAEAGEGGGRVLPGEEWPPRAPALHGGRALLPRRPLPPRYQCSALLCSHMFRSRAGSFRRPFHWRSSSVLRRACSPLLTCCAVRVDVIDRLDALRGNGMARMYSWASKR